MSDWTQAEINFSIKKSQKAQREQEPQLIHWFLLLDYKSVYRYVSNVFMKI